MILSGPRTGFLILFGIALLATTSVAFATPSCPSCTIQQVGGEGDAVVQVPDYRSGTGQVYLARTREFLSKVVEWKMAFVIYTSENRNEYLFALSPWRNVERDSAHAVIRRAINVVTGAAQPLDFDTLPVGFREVQRGYLRPSGSRGIEIYDLCGAAIYRYSGFNGSILSQSAETVKDAFLSQFSLVVDFSPPDEFEEVL